MWLHGSITNIGLKFKYMRGIKAGRGQAFDAVALSRLILNEDFEGEKNR